MPKATIQEYNKRWLNKKPARKPSKNHVWKTDRFIEKKESKHP